MLAGHWADRWDIAFASIGVEQDRMAELYFTKPYIGSPERLWVRTDDAAQQMSDLDGKRIGVCTACWADLYLQKKLSVPGMQIDFKVDGAQIVGYAVEVSGLQDVVDGKLDAFLCADTVAQGLIDRVRRCGASSRPPTSGSRRVPSTSRPASPRSRCTTSSTTRSRPASPTGR